MATSAPDEKTKAFSFGVLVGVSLASLTCFFLVSTLGGVEPPRMGSAAAGIEVVSNDTARLFGRPYCDFDEARDWGSVSVPSCAHEGESEARSFIMVFMGESGSTALQAGIMKHSRVYGRDPEDQYVGGDMELIETVVGESNQLARVHEYFGKAAEAGKIPGFKVRPIRARVVLKAHRQFQPPRIIWNYRRNILSRAIGMVHKRVQELPPGGFNDSSSFSDYCKTTGTCTFKIDIQDLIDTVQHAMIGDLAIMSGIKNVNVSCILPVTYEEFDECPDRVFAQIYKFLGVHYEYHAPERTKITAAEPCTMVENWNEVCNTFMPCRDMRWMVNSHYACKCLELNPELLTPEKCPIPMTLLDDRDLYRPNELLSQRIAK